MAQLNKVQKKKNDRLSGATRDTAKNKCPFGLPTLS